MCLNFCKTLLFFTVWARRKHQPERVERRLAELLGRRIEQLGREAVALAGVVRDQVGEVGEARLLAHEVHARGLVAADAVVVDAALPPHRDRQLLGARLGLAHQEGAVYARGEQVLGLDALDSAVVPVQQMFS